MFYVHITVSLQRHTTLLDDCMLHSCNLQPKSGCQDAKLHGKPSPLGPFWISEFAVIPVQMINNCHPSSTNPILVFFCFELAVQHFVWTSSVHTHIPLTNSHFSWNLVNLCLRCSVSCVVPGGRQCTYDRIQVVLATTIRQHKYSYYL